MKYRILITILLAFHLVLSSCKDTQKNKEKKIANTMKDANLTYATYTPKSTDREISRSAYADKLYRFWLAQCIANWTGLVTEMDKVGNIGETKTG